MAKARSLDEALEVVKSEGGEFFTIDDDMETALVRFLYSDPNAEDLDWFIVHEVTIQGKKRYIECLQDETCPCCRKGMWRSLKLFLQLEDYRDGKKKVWERGKTFVPTIKDQIRRYGSLVNRKFEIQRKGKKGDENTKYEFFALDADGGTLEQYEREPLISDDPNVDLLVLRKDAATMELIVQGRYIPPRRFSDQAQGASASAQAAAARSAGIAYRDDAPPSGEEIF